MSQSAELNLNLHPKQGEALQTNATEVLYGGAAGGGKSHLMRVAAILWCSAIPGLQVYLFRRIRDDLQKNHMEGPKGFRAMLAGWEQSGFCKIVEDEIRFWNGSKIYLCHCKDEKDIYKYQGAEIHVLLIDELTHFTEAMYRFLRNRVRMVGVNVPADYQGMFPRILCGANPGNIGHLWVKTTFVMSAPAMAVVKKPANDGGMLRQFIPARLEDNPSMTTDDPGYELRLEGLGSESLVKAMRYGDWDVIEGAFFDKWHVWKENNGIIAPCALPEHWLRFRSGDWGSARPFSFGWWAVASEDFIHPDGFVIPKGAIVRYREWYGVKRDESGTAIANTGLKMTASAVGARLLELEAGDPPNSIGYGVLDPAAFAEDGGPSIAERIYEGSGRKVGFRRADNKRVAQRGAMGGWDQMRARMDGEEIEPGKTRPMLYMFNTCLDSLRTIPALQHDKTRIEDLDTDGEDHAADEVRYACMSRPYTKPTPPEQKPIPGVESVTMETLWNDLDKKQRRRRR